jgi:hypothetical protein
MYSGKCPHCEKTIASLLVETLDINAGAIFPQATYKGATYLCPHCHAVLGASMDQIALNVDLVQRLLKALGRG